MFQPDHTTPHSDNDHIEPDWTLPLDHPPYAVDGSTDGEVVGVAAGHVVMVVAALTGEPLSTLVAEVALCTIKFSPDGSLVAAAGNESVSVWSVETGCVRFQLRSAQTKTTSCCGEDSMHWHTHPLAHARSTGEIYGSLNVHTNY